ncbi:hypothetical protein [Rhodoplanes sp. Z2-YC6860]|uniref:hypothetical protein n=1 Tax=Rhodoplanes sp. Z2-YC6860 TaxID=674703 RepID=UPI0008319691|nr:hypothetical protein [Rhodoplanes sp. Z2-YC6860]
MNPGDDEDELDETADRCDAMDRALAVHEAGHTVVARALGADVLFVEIDLATGNGKSRSSQFDGSPIKNLAVCVAGCRAEHLLDAHSSRRTKVDDRRLMREILLRFPDAERRLARAEGYRLADATLRANAVYVRKVADGLLARRWISDSATVRIDGVELAALLAFVHSI